MAQEIKYLESAPGNKSNSRRIAWYAFWAGLFFAQQFILLGALAYLMAPDPKPELNVMSISGAAASIFSAIAGSAMIFAFGQKYNEKTGQ